MPKRIQMSRQKPWRVENSDAVIVARPHDWGNPFSVGSPVESHGRTVVVTQPLAVALFDAWLHQVYGPGIDEQIARELGGRDLACWCPLDQPCHADVLLAIANPASPDSGSSS